MRKLCDWARRVAAHGGILACAIGLVGAPAISAQDKYAASYYPRFVRGDVEVCRSELSALQQEYHQHLEALIEYTRASGREPKSLSDSIAELARSKRLDPVTWFEVGVEGDMFHAGIGGLKAINADTARTGWITEAEYRRYAAGLDNLRKPWVESPQFVWRAFYWRAATFGSALACTSKIWLRKFDAMHAPKPTAANRSASLATSPPRAAVSSSPASRFDSSVAGMPAAQVAECTKLATDKQRESQTWPGDVASRSARLGDYQKELFLGRCAGHPEAKNYIANAEAMMEAATNTSVSTTGVSECLTPVRTSDVGRFENKCGFKINFAYCNAGKLSGDGKPAFSCGESGAVDSVGPNNFQGALISFAKITYFFACRAPLLPQTEYEPGRGIIGQCK